MLEQDACNNNQKLLPPRIQFIKTHSIDINSDNQLSDSYQLNNHSRRSLVSSPNTQNIIPDEEVVSYFYTDDNQSHSSNKVVRFSEPATNNQFSFKYRKQCSIPERVVEDQYGESESSPFGKHDFRIKEDRMPMNQSTNLLHEFHNNNNDFTINAMSLQNSSFHQRTISSLDQADRINQLVEELVSIVKNFINDISVTEKHFSFDDCDDSNSKYTLQQKVLKRAIENLNFKLAVQTCSPISKISVTSPHFEECLNVKELQAQCEELQEQNELLKDKVEILNLKIEQLQENENQLQKQVKELEFVIQSLQNTKSKPPQSKQRTRTTNSFHEVSAPLDNFKLSSQQHSPRKNMITKVKKQQPDGTIYIGSMLNEMKQGYGILMEKDQEIYMGFWHQDRFNGFGLLKNKNQINDLFNNVGSDESFNLDQWSMYQGEFKDGLFEGYGILTLNDSSRFHGFFKKGKANGKGTYYAPNRSVMGDWRDNQKI